MTDRTADLRRLRGIRGRIVAYIMAMGMAVKVVRCMTLTAITRGGRRCIRCSVMTG